MNKNFEERLRFAIKAPPSQLGFEVICKFFEAQQHAGKSTDQLLVYANQKLEKWPDFYRRAAIRSRDFTRVTQQKYWSLVRQIEFLDFLNLNDGFLAELDCSHLTGIFAGAGMPVGNLNALAKNKSLFNLCEFGCGDCYVDDENPDRNRDKQLTTDLVEHVSQAFWVKNLRRFSVSSDLLSVMSGDSVLPNLQSVTIFGTDEFLAIMPRLTRVVDVHLSEIENCEELFGKFPRTTQYLTWYRPPVDFLELIENLPLKGLQLYAIEREREFAPPKRGDVPLIVKTQ